MKKSLLVLVASALPAALSLQAFGALLINFDANNGGTGHVATGQTTVNASTTPYYSGPAGLTGSLTWNNITGSDTNTNITFPASYQFSDGSPAAGVSVALATGNTVTSISGGTPYVRAGWGSGGRSSVGVFAFPSGSQDIYASFASAVNTGGVPYLGVDVSGLSAGQYVVYVISNNSYNQNATDATRDLRIGAAHTGLTDYSSLSTQTLAYNFANITADTATWTAAQGKYWGSSTVTIDGTNSDIYIGINRSPTENQNGVIDAIQIVPLNTPEPASLSALTLGSAALLLRRRK